MFEWALSKKNCRPWFALCTLAASVFWFLPSLSNAQGLLPAKWQVNFVNNPTSVAYSPDGTLLAVGGYNGAEIYSVATHQPLTGLQMPVDEVVSSLAFSHDGKTLYVGDSFGELQFWNVSDGTLRTSFPTTLSSVGSMSVSPDGSSLAISGLIGTQPVVEIWNIPGAYLVSSFQSLATQIYSVAYSPDGKTIADSGTNGFKGVVEVWNVATGTLRGNLNTAANPVWSVAISPNGTYIAVCGNGSKYGVIELWDLASLTFVRSFPTVQPTVASVAFSPDSQTLADIGNTYYFSQGIHYSTSYWVGALESWNVSTGTFQSSMNGYPAGPQFNSVVYSPSGQSITVAAVTTAQSGYPVPDAGTVITFQAPDLSYSWGVNTGVSGSTSPVFSRDGSRILGGGMSPGNNGINVWNSQTGALLGQFAAGLTIAPRSAIYSADGSVIALGFQNSIQIWNVAANALIQTLNLGALQPVCMQFSPDGTKLAVGGLSTSDTPVVAIWDLKTGKAILDLNTAANQGMSAVTFSPDGTMLASCGYLFATNATDQGVVELWNTSTGKKIKSLGTAASRTFDVNFSPDGKSLAVAGSSSSGAIGEIWNVSTGNLIINLPLIDGSAEVYSLKFAPDGKTIFAGTYSNAGIQVFATPNYNLLGYFNGPVSSVSISPDGSLIAYVTQNSSPVVCPFPEFESYAIKGFTLNPTSITLGSTSTGTVTLAQPAPAGGVPVGIGIPSSASLNSPPFVTVPQGATSVSFPVGTNVYTNAGAYQISVSSGSNSKSASLTVAASVPTSITLDPSSVLGGNTSAGTVYLNGPRGLSGSPVSLSSNSPVVTVPATIATYADATSIPFTVTTTVVSAATTATITATSNGVSVSTTITVYPVQVASVGISPNSVNGGAGSTATVLLNGPAPTYGAVVQLKSNSLSLLTPPSVTIPAGATSAQFTVRTAAVATSQVASLTASSGGASQTTTIAINSPQLLSVTLAQLSVVGGGQCAVTVKLTSPAPVTGLTVSLASTQNSALVPATVKIPGGQALATFQIKTTPVPTTSYAVITGKLLGKAQTAILTITSG